LFGPDFKAIKNLNQQMEQNQARIQELQQLANQTQNQADQAQLQEMIQASESAKYRYDRTRPSRRTRGQHFWLVS
jgi:5-bromo-4-chloroindolyl phosphate hydrolysis protein